MDVQQQNAGMGDDRQQLGAYAHQAVQKHFKKSVKHEKAVLADTDPEALHQMRVGMRRLRTALQVFMPALVLPPAANDRQIKKIAQRLGSVRDLDVLKAKLQDRYRPDLEGKERKQLDKVLNGLEQQRQQRFANVQQLLKGDRYRQFKQSFQTWLAEPEYDPIANLPILLTLPDLLLPLISNLLLHPGWLVGARAAGAPDVLPEPSDRQVRQWLEQDSEPLHDLRKQMKGVRYQTEFFTEFFDRAYQTQMQDFQAVQEVLGEIQDYAVLKAFLAEQLSDWQTAMPTLSQRLDHEQIHLWGQWQPFQRRYLDAEFRQQLRQLVLSPQNHGTADRTPTDNSSTDDSTADRTPNHGAAVGTNGQH